MAVEIEHLALDRFEHLGFKDISGGMSVLIDMCFDWKVVKKKNCQPHKRFHEQAGTAVSEILRGSIETEQYPGLLRAAFARAGALAAREISVPELLGSVIVFILYVLPKEHDNALREISRRYDYGSADRRTVPAALRKGASTLVYIASIIEHEMVNEGYLAIYKKGRQGYFAALQDKCFDAALI